ncbi:hypothetical protein HHI36_005240 [Cryptolaemus montrouzieri]|uniref:Dopa decarboxylase n=1 Tax=Cryptolaemus montrouzieri TaxID=559131 RepID=A0ABD2NTH2_9CUCU
MSYNTYIGASIEKRVAPNIPRRSCDFNSIHACNNESCYSCTGRVYSTLIQHLNNDIAPTDSDGCLRGSTLQKAVEQDRKNGFHPCCVIATFGTTGICSFDKVEEIGDVCQKESIWLHIDAAYAGTALICPEYRYLMKGIEKVDSFNFNPHKWMKVNSDCSALWFKDTTHVEQLNTNREKPINKSSTTPEIQLWQIPNCRRFRALKLWFVLRINGVKGLQKHVRQQVGLAKHFESLVRSDERFEICTSNLGVVTFRLKGLDDLTNSLLERIHQDKKLFVAPYLHKQKFVIRFVVCSSFTEQSDIENSWNQIKNHANKIVVPKRKRKGFSATRSLKRNVNLNEAKMKS